MPGALRHSDYLLASGTSRADVAIGIAESQEAQQFFPIGVEQGWIIA